jgi:16S rRNA (cytosine967-C5)-methyltransferase
VPSPARGAAFEVLTRVDERRGEPASLLHHRRFESLSRPDRDLATEITLGVLRHRASLDRVLSGHSSRPLDRLDPALLRALRIGLYQIRHLDRVPERAAVDESVRLARAYGASRGAGLVNAVLRSILRRPDVPPLPDKESSPLEYLTTTLSHPRWLAARYLDRLGLETAEARCRIQNEPPPNQVRISTRIGLDDALARLAAEGIEAEPVAAVPGALSLGRHAPAESALFREGLLFAQDAGSQLVPSLLDLRARDRVLDVCAAPGGKTTAMSERVPEGRVFAVDRRARRVRLLVALAARLGAANVDALVADGTRLPFAIELDRILVDAPCTSIGTIRRNPDIKWRVEERDLARLAEVQYRLLRSASERLAIGGRLVYATCSTEPEENEHVVDRFLAECRGFAIVDGRQALPAAARHLACPRGFLRTFPERDGMDGYFAAVLTRA